MKRIVPAILTDNKKDFNQKIEICKKFTDYVQIDIMNNTLTSSKSVLPKDFFYTDFGDLKFEAHIMADKKSSEEIIASLKSFPSCVRIIIHKEATESLEELRQLLNQIKDIGKEVGVAINPDTDIREVGKVVKKISTVLFMGVNPGFYGSKFKSEVLDKVIDFKERYTLSELEISWDGGVNKETIPQILESGAESIAVGSAIFNSENPELEYKNLVKLIS